MRKMRGLFICGFFYECFDWIYAGMAYVYLMHKQVKRKVSEALDQSYRCVSHLLGAGIEPGSL